MKLAVPIQRVGRVWWHVPVEDAAARAVENHARIVEVRIPSALNRLDEKWMPGGADRKSIIEATAESPGTRGRTVDLPNGRTDRGERKVIGSTAGTGAVAHIVTAVATGAGLIGRSCTAPDGAICDWRAVPPED